MLTPEVHEQITALMFQADRSGIQQLRNKARDEHGNVCAGQYILDHSSVWNILYHTYIEKCPECGSETFTSGTTPHRTLFNMACLIVHYNNDHQWDWLTIARKLPMSL